MRILSVDDDPIILDLLTEVLASVGQADVTIAESAAQAFEILQSDCLPFDCFLLDIQMPEIDGIQLCEALRQMPLYQRTPIIMITAMSDKSYIDKAFSAGAMDYVTKPFDVVELGARVRIAESLVEARQSNAKIISAATPSDMSYQIEKSYTLAERLPIDDVDGVIDYIALENYICQLSRGSLFGSSILGFHITDVERIFQASSAFDYESIITDVAESITNCLRCSQYLVSYAGNGTFACVYSSDQKLDPAAFEKKIRNGISSMGLYYSDGRPIVLTVVAGNPVRLTFRSGQQIADALFQACISAENAGYDYQTEASNRYIQGKAG